MAREVPVIRKDQDGSISIVLIDFDSIEEWGTDKYDLICRNHQGWFYWIDSLEKTERIPGFERTDRATVVRMDRVKRYDSNLKTFHFNKDTHDPHVIVSRRHRKRLNLE